MNTALVKQQDDRRSQRPLILAVVLILMALVLSACGAKIQTTLTIDAKGAGSRVMALSATLDAQSAENVNGGAEAIDASIKKHLPDQLEYSGMKVDGEALSATLTLNFGSIEDYRTKVTALLAESGVDQKAEITFANSPGTALISGVTLEENFKSEDLLGWLADGLVVDGVVKESDRHSIFDTSDVTKVSIDGTDYPVNYEPISIREVQENGFDLVSVNLDITSGSGYDVTIAYGTKSSPSGPIKEIQSAFLEQATVAGAELSSQLPTGLEGSNFNAGYTMTFHSDDDAALQRDLVQALGSENITWSSKTIDPQKDSLVYTVTYSGSIDLSQISNSYAYKHITMTVPASWSGDADRGLPDEDGNIAVSSSSTDAVDMSFQHGITVTNISAQLDVGMNREVIQTYALTVAAQDSQTLGDAIKAALVGSNSELAVSVDSAEDSDQQSSEESGAQSGTAAGTTYTLTVPSDQSLKGITASTRELQDGTYGVFWEGNLSDLLPGAAIQQATATVDLGLWNSFVSQEQSAVTTAWDVQKNSATKTMSPADGFNLVFFQSAQGWTVKAFIGLCVGLGVLLIVIILVVIFRKKIAGFFKKIGASQPASASDQPGYQQPPLPGGTVSESDLFVDSGTSFPPAQSFAGLVPAQSVPVQPVQPVPTQPAPQQARPAPELASPSDVDNGQQMPQQRAELNKQGQPPRQGQEADEFDEFNLM